jgi:biopolymer transport protein ExbB
MTLQPTKLLFGLVVLGFTLAFPDLAKAQESPGSVPADRAEATKPPAGTIDYYHPLVVMQKGGPLMWPILLCSLVSITFGLERFIHLRKRRVIPPRFTRQFIDQLQRRELSRTAAMKLCAANPSPMASIFLAAVRHWGSPSFQIEAAITEAGQREIALLRRNLRALQGSANLATLLGLLGTIFGMIQAFNDVAVLQAIGRAEILANGIAQALLTTAGGLTVAIPSIFLHTYFAGRVERLVQQMDELATQVVDSISAEAGMSIDNGTAKTPGGRVVPKYVS